MPEIGRHEESASLLPVTRRTLIVGPTGAQRSAVTDSPRDTLYHLKYFTLRDATAHCLVHTLTLFPLQNSVLVKNRFLNDMAMQEMQNSYELRSCKGLVYW